MRVFKLLDNQKKVHKLCTKATCFLGLLIFIWFASFLTACDKQSTTIDKKKADKPLNQPAVQIKPAIKNTLLAVPAGMEKPKKLLQRTTLIGTEDHPTIDGGVINAADGIPVSHDDFKEAEPKPKATIKATHPAKTIYTAPVSVLQDNWATSNKVKALLEQAAKGGKLDYVLKKTDEIGLPATMATVPMIESNYQEQALSPKGAAGIWQLMPSLAKDYGLNSQDRYLFLPSTEVALKHLKSLHAQFGSWELALAAYNAGTARVQKALASNPKASSLQELDLPLETKAYVTRIMNLNKAFMVYQDENNGR